MISLLAALLFAQTLGPEVPLSAGVAGASGGVEQRPRLAAIGDRALTAWSTADGHTTSVVLTRDGHASRAAELPAGSAFFRDLIAAGDRFLILYSDLGGTRIASYDVDGGRIAVTELPRDTDMALAWNGTRGLAIGLSGQAVFLDGAGNPAGERFVVAPPAPNTLSFSAAPAANGFVILWQTFNAVYATFLDNGGATGEATKLGESTSPGPFWDRPAAAYGGGRTLVAWKRDDALLGAFRGEDGAWSAPFAIAARGAAGYPSVAWNGAAFVVVYPVDGTDVVAVHVSPSGAVTMPRIIAATPRDERYPSVAIVGGEEVFAWESDAPCSSGEVEAYASVGGAPILLSEGKASELTPAVAYAGSSLLITYTERSDLSRVRFAPPSESSQVQPAIGTDGQAFLLAWLEVCDGRVRVAPVGGEARTIGTGANLSSRPVVTWTGSEYWVLWEQNQPVRVMGARVSRAGAPLGDPIPLTNAVERPPDWYDIRARSCSLVRIGGQWLLVWQYLRSSQIPLYPDPPPTIQVIVQPLASDLHPQGAPNVIANGWSPAAASELVVWSALDGMHAGRLTAAGTLATDHRIGGSAGFAELAPLVWTGHDYALAAGSSFVRLSPDGDVLTSDVLDGVQADVAASGDALTVVYQRAGRVYARSAMPVPPRRRAVK